LGWVSRPGYQTFSTSFVADEQVDDLRGVLLVAVHANTQRLHAAQRQVAVQWSGNRPDRVLEEPQLLGQFGVTRDDGTADDVGVSPEVLRRRVHDDVGTVGEWRLQIGRRERVVDDEFGPVLVRHLGDAAMSTMRRYGLLGVSVHTSAVFSCHDEETASRSERSATSV
jgi:hypothetical protein